MWRSSILDTCTHRGKWARASADVCTRPHARTHTSTHHMLHNTSQKWVTRPTCLLWCLLSFPFVAFALRSAKWSTTKHPLCILHAWGQTPMHAVHRLLQVEKTDRQTGRVRQTMWRKMLKWRRCWGDVVCGHVLQHLPRELSQHLLRAFDWSTTRCDSNKQGVSTSTM